MVMEPFMGRKMAFKWADAEGRPWENRMIY